MTRFTKLISAINVGLLMFSSHCLAMQSSETKSLKFGYSEFAPYTFTDKSGRAVGDVTGIIETVVAKSGYEFSPIDGPNRRLFRSLVTDDIDLLMVVPFKNDQSHKLIFGDKVFDTLDMSIFWLEGTTPPINQLSQLSGKPIISIAGYSYGGIFREEGALEWAERFNSENHPSAVKALLQNRAPYLLAYEKPVMFYLDKPYQAGLRSYSLEKIPLVLSIRGSYPDAANVLKKLESRYEELFPERFKQLNPSAIAE